MQGKQTSLTIAGETHTMREWAKIVDLHPETIRHRLKRGLSASSAVFGEKRANEEQLCSQPRRNPLPRSFPVGPLPQWGGVVSITFRRAA